MRLRTGVNFPDSGYIPCSTLPAMSFLANLSWAQLMTITVIILTTGVVLGIYIAHVMQRSKAFAPRVPPAPGGGEQDAKGGEGGHAAADGDEERRNETEADHREGDGEADGGDEKGDGEEEEEEQKEGEGGAERAEDGGNAQRA